ncbi:MAG: hypothetical protein HY023_08545 [Chloroflexi bacterium]|nr:hypothetical protein [Chloroflexota bacterium]
MFAKRIALFVMSILIGLAGTTGTLLIFNVDPKHFAWSNTALLFVAYGVFAGVWLDYFLGTDLMKS